MIKNRVWVALIICLETGCGNVANISLNLAVSSPTPSEAPEEVARNVSENVPLPEPSVDPSPEPSPDPMINVKLEYRYPTNSPVVCGGHILNLCEITRSIKTSEFQALKDRNISCTFHYNSPGLWLMQCSPCHGTLTGCETLYTCLHPSGTSRTTCEWDPLSTLYP